MQQNIMILLVVLVVGVGIVAAVIMMSGGGEPAPTTEPTVPTTIPTVPTTPSTAPTIPTTPSAPGGGQVDVGSDVIAAMSAGSPVICTMIIDMAEANADPSLQGITTTMVIKMEHPKTRADATSMGVASLSIISPDGVNAYMNIPMLGANTWYQSTVDEGTEMPGPEEIGAMLAQLPAGVSINCEISGDIPDSEFQLPPGAEVVPIEQLEQGMPGS